MGFHWGSKKISPNKNIKMFLVVMMQLIGLFAMLILIEVLFFVSLSSISLSHFTFLLSVSAIAHLKRWEEEGEFECVSKGDVFGDNTDCLCRFSEGLRDDPKSDLSAGVGLKSFDTHSRESPHPSLEKKEENKEEETVKVEREPQGKKEDKEPAESGKKFIRLSKKPKHQNLGILCGFLCILPLVVLSFAPHQEPRFLVPLVVPLVFCVYLHGFRLVGTSSRRDGKGDHIVRVMWVLFNIGMCLFYGVCHQGYVTTAAVEV